MAINLILNSQKILEKVFPGATNGYNPLLVDEFLDMIIKDYLVIEQNALVEQKQIDALNNKINELEAKIKNLEIENEKYRIRFTNIKENDNVNLDNIELVKKINKYEKFIYNHGYNPQSIK